VTESSWEWLLPTGGTVKARVDAEGIESVWVGPRLASRSPPGGKPEGHVVRLGAADGGVYRAGNANELTVTFHPANGVATLEIAGAFVPPTTPGDAEPISPRGPQGPTPLVVAVAGVAVLFVCATAFGLSRIAVRSAHATTALAVPPDSPMAAPTAQAAAPPAEPSDEPDDPPESSPSPWAAGDDDRPLSPPVRRTPRVSPASPPVKRPSPRPDRGSSPRPTSGVVCDSSGACQGVTLNKRGNDVVCDANGVCTGSKKRR
jgi:hypothetical protein